MLYTYRDGVVRSRSGNVYFQAEEDCFFSEKQFLVFGLSARDLTGDICHDSMCSALRRSTQYFAWGNRTERIGSEWKLKCKEFNYRVYTESTRMWKKLRIQHIWIWLAPLIHSPLGDNSFMLWVMRDEFHKQMKFDKLNSWVSARRKSGKPPFMFSNLFFSLSLKNCSYG